MSLVPRPRNRGWARGVKGRSLDAQSPADQDFHDAVALTPDRLARLDRRQKALDMSQRGHIARAKVTEAERTDRDRLLLRLWNRGRDTHQIAAATGYSERHVRRLLTELLD